jgi:hypothetical protein
MCGAPSPAMRSSFSTHLLRSSLSPATLSSHCARVSVRPNGGVAVRKESWVCRPQSVQLRVGFHVEAYKGGHDTAMDAASGSSECCRCVLPLGFRVYGNWRPLFRFFEKVRDLVQVSKVQIQE